ncbi:SIR2 family protein [Paenibacillus massiliensis]|uniref:SIR2 family protein n=1 Tax=Paenibacillus massiliensis TaxID=225917 RepID=UPI0003FAB519|nr:SIR2 family protein [Paenibacillus massiliensis]
MADIKQIEDLLKESQSLPFLFIGSGVSKRYISTESWPGILDRFARIVDSSDFAYEKYENRARQALLERDIPQTTNNLMTKMADYIENDFNTLWFDSQDFSERRDKFREEVRSGVTPFKLELADYFRTIDMATIAQEYQDEIALLGEVGVNSIAGVLTTNYDCLMEHIFPEYEVYVGQEQLIFSPTYGVNEIYKVHGCSTQPNSVVINSRDYENFDKRNAYLAAKLMTIFVEHPIIFLGYSLDDENVQAILKSIVDCLSDENLNKLRDRLIFVEWKKGHETTEVFPYSRSFTNGKTVSMTKIVTDSYVSLLNVLVSNKAKYSTSFYRKVRKNIYELALTEDGHEKIRVLASTDDRLMEGDVEILIGFGIFELGKRGYKSISSEEVFKDILFDEGKFNKELLINESLPELLKRTSGSLPVFKYINNYSPDLPIEFERFKNFSFKKLENETIRKHRKGMIYTSIDEIIRKTRSNLGAQVRYIQMLTPKQIEVERLGEYCRERLTEDPHILRKSNLSSGIKKLIRMYDFLKFKE